MFCQDYEESFYPETGHCNASQNQSRKKRRYVPHALRTSDSVNKRNARERRRMQRFNDAFDALKSRLPQLKNAKKRVAKERIMREAVDYIRHLVDVLGVVSPGMPKNVTPSPWFKDFLSPSEASLSSTNFAHLMSCMPAESSSSDDSEDDTHFKETTTSLPASYVAEETSLYADDMTSFPSPASLVSDVDLNQIFGDGLPKFDAEEIIAAIENNSMDSSFADDTTETNNSNVTTDSDIIAQAVAQADLADDVLNSPIDFALI